MLKIAFDPIYKYALPQGHRFPMLKYELLPEQLLYEGTIKEEQFFTPGKLTNDELATTHTREYIIKLNNNELTAKEGRKIGFPIRPSLIERGKVIARGTYECALYALQSKVSLNIAGGTHHSFSDHGEGFCIFNDIALSCNLLLNQGVVSRILIVDLDVHQGNGTASIFQRDDRVFTFSMHGEKNYPTRKEISDLDIGLKDKTEDKLYLQKLYDNLPRLIQTHQPEVIFYLSGVDIIASDKLGRLSVSLEGCRLRDEFVLRQAHLNQIPIVCSMGGGYSPLIKDIIEAHANTFRAAMDIFY